MALTASRLRVTSSTVITAEALLAHWQGHRRVTRRAIEAFRKISFLAFRLEECARFLRWLRNL